MSAMLRMQQYQRQAVLSATPEQLVLKLYDLGITSCFRGDRAKLRAVLVELLSSLNYEKGGEIATRLRDIYDYCLRESATEDLKTVSELLTGLRDAWRDGVLSRRAA